MNEVIEKGSAQDFIMHSFLDVLIKMWAAWHIIVETQIGFLENFIKVN